jgi:hypothetical protein
MIKETNENEDCRTNRSSEYYIIMKHAHVPMHNIPKEDDTPITKASPPVTPTAFLA